jgi:excisionase family DNA binding protein
MIEVGYRLPIGSGGQFFISVKEVRSMIKLYTAEEVAEILKVSSQSILNWIHAEKLKGIKVGGTYRVKESDLKKFLGE